jgi:hypothetical protein
MRRIILVAIVLVFSVAVIAAWIGPATASTNRASATWVASKKDSFERDIGHPNLRWISAKYLSGQGAFELRATLYKPLAEDERESYLLSFSIGRCGGSGSRPLDAYAYLDGSPAYWNINSGADHPLTAEWNVSGKQVTFTFSGPQLVQRAWVECVSADVDFYSDREHLVCDYDCYWTKLYDWDETGDAHFRKVS